MKNVNYDREVEPEPELSLKFPKALPSDVRGLLHEFGGTKRRNIRADYCPENTDDHQTTYDEGPGVHHFEELPEAFQYVSGVMGRDTSQPMEFIDHPLYHEELGEDVPDDHMVTSIPNPTKLTLDGEIEAGVHAAGLGNNQGGFYFVNIAIPTYGCSIQGQDEEMNDGELHISSQGQLIDPEAENPFQETHRVAEDFEDMMKRVGEL